MAINEESIKRLPRRKDAYFHRVACRCGCRTFTCEVLPKCPGEPDTEEEGNPNIHDNVIGVMCEACKKTIFYNGC